VTFIFIIIIIIITIIIIIMTKPICSEPFKGISKWAIWSAREQR